MKKSTRAKSRTGVKNSNMFFEKVRFWKIVFCCRYSSVNVFVFVLFLFSIVSFVLFSEIALNLLDFICNVFE